MRMTRRLLVFIVFTAGILSQITEGRKHQLSLSDDERSVIVVTKFGYLEGGFLEVKITGLKISPTTSIRPYIGFSFDKSSSSGSSSYVEKEESTHRCVLRKDGNEEFEDVPRAVLRIDLEDEHSLRYSLQIRERLMKGLRFFENKAQYEATGKAPDASKDKSSIKTEVPVDETDNEEKDNLKGEENKDEQPASDAGADTKPEANPSINESEPTPSRRRRAAVAGPSPKDGKSAEGYVELEKPLPIEGNFDIGLNFSFFVPIETKEQIGLYELYFHNCMNSPYQAEVAPEQLKPIKVEFTANVVEMNVDSYLSAGDMALPAMYGVMSFMFFVAGIIWIRMISLTEEKVFKIHYLMAVIILIKGLSVMFHSLDYFFIAKDGRTEAWAVIYYIIHLLKGILLIICLLLIGTGWAFIKYILSDRDKKLFMIVIPMQVMVNVAYIIMEETEEGNKSYYTWKNIVILVDVLCCGAILIPVVWSIRHLQEASETDGKAAINLAKLELFRHFYIMVVCYLYFTRIIVYLLEITLPFQYIWIYSLFSELGAFVFFCVTGYKFRPGCDNPYLKLDQYDSDEDPEEAITQTGLTETVSRVNKHEKDVTETDEFDVLIPKQRTSKV